MVETDANQTVQRELLYGAGVDRIELSITTSTYPTNQYPLQDALNSVVEVVDAYGSVQTTFGYGPFGETTRTGAEFPYAYTGRRYYAGHEIYDYRARAYRPETGTFLQRDPIGIWGDGIGWGNGYAYVGNDPINRNDPSGLGDEGGRTVPFVRKDPPPEPEPEPRGQRSQGTICILPPCFPAYGSIAGKYTWIRDGNQLTLQSRRFVLDSIPKDLQFHYRDIDRFAPHYDLSEYFKDQALDRASDSMDKLPPRMRWWVDREKKIRKELKLTSIKMARRSNFIDYDFREKVVMSMVLMSATLLIVPCSEVVVASGAAGATTVGGVGAAAARGRTVLYVPRTVAVASRPSSRALGRALELAGHTRPVQSAAHHIVAGAAEAAAPARAVLQRFGIGVNDAVNGVFLPATRAAQNAAGAAVHSTLHTRAYYQAVNDLLGQATTRAEALEVLEVLRNALLSGGI